MSNDDLNKAAEAIADLIVGSQRLVVFTGAGISTESGIPDFRGPDGLWTKVDPEDFGYQNFVTNRETRRRVWLLNTEGFAFDKALPNAAHLAVAELEKMGKLDCVITQNVDGLHQKAGNAEDKVIQLHGNMQSARCLDCGARHPFAEVREWIESGDDAPDCRKCGGILKPEAIFFGEAMPVRETSEAQTRSRACDLCIVIGSTLTVYPAGLMPQYAVNSGAKLVIINQGATELDHLADVRVSASAGDLMSLTLARVKEKLGTSA